MKKYYKKINKKNKAFAMPLILMCMLVLMALGVGLLAIGQNVRLNAIRQKNETISYLAAEAGYEDAIFWMGRQQDVAYVMQGGGEYTNDIKLPNSACDYKVSFYSFVGARPAYRILSEGRCGIYKRNVDVLVLQELSGWDMGQCRIPSGATTTTPVYFADKEIIDMPLHINKLNDSPDEKDIHIKGNPKFLNTASFSELRHTSGGYDKYKSVLHFFKQGVSFGQPNSRITHEASMNKKIKRFRDNTKSSFKFTPKTKGELTNKLPATQIEFFVDKGVGKIRITNHCTVRGFQQNSNSKTWDYRITKGSKGTQFERYYTYGYHVTHKYADKKKWRKTSNVTDTYVTYEIGGMESEPGGQIYVNGNVIIGGDNTLHSNDQIVKGRITIVSTKDIWIADSIKLDGAHDADGMPSEDNPNALGLIAKGVIKVVDPGMSDYSYVDGSPVEPANNYYAPIGRPSGGSKHIRYLPDPMIVEASITVAGGGWGAENVRRGYYGGRKEANGKTDYLILRGTISESIRGVVGIIGSDGFTKQYYFDERLIKGLLPGDMWLKSKFVPAPAGWHDYRGTAKETF